MPSDLLQITVKCPEKTSTKRGALSVTHSLFDPLDLVASVLLEAKLLLLSLCGKDWDKALSESEELPWKHGRFHQIF